MKKSVMLLLAAVLSCKDAAAPKPYSIAGTWEGSAGAGSLHLELVESGTDLVGGSGVYTIGGTAYPFTLNTAGGAPAGYLRDSAFFAVLTASPGQASCGGSANVQGVFRRQEADAESFVAHYSCSAMTFQGTVTRK